MWTVYSSTSERIRSIPRLGRRQQEGYLAGGLAQSGLLYAEERRPAGVQQEDQEPQG